MDMMIIIKFRMMYKKFVACDFKLQPFYFHNASSCNINMKSLQLSNSVELLVYFCKIWYPALSLCGRNDKDLTKPVWEIRGAHLSQKYRVTQKSTPVWPSVK